MRPLSARFAAVVSLVVAAASATLPGTAVAAPPSAIYVFGDSLSDTGNVAETVYKRNFFNPPSFHDSYTNGPVALELLAEFYGLRADPSLWATGHVDVHDLFGPGFVPGTNYAVGGATATDRGRKGLNLDLPEQVSAFQAYVGGLAPNSALYVVMIGGNDVRTAAHALDTGFVTSGVAAELAQLQSLINSGARQLLVVNVPDVSAIPEFISGPADQRQAAQADSLLYNANLLAGVQALSLANPNASVGYFDLYTYGAQILASAQSLGFFNTTDACYSSPPLRKRVTASAGCGPVTSTGATHVDGYIFWDTVHPTARIHALWAQGMAAALPVATSWSLPMVGLAVTDASAPDGQRIPARPGS